MGPGRLASCTEPCSLCVCTRVPVGGVRNVSMGAECVTCLWYVLGRGLRAAVTELSVIVMGPQVADMLWVAHWEGKA